MSFIYDNNHILYDGGEFKLRYFKSIFKISIILLLLIITVGSISATDSSDSAIDDSQDNDFDLDEDLDDGSDDDSDDEDLDEDLDDDDDLDDSDDEDWDDDFDESDFDYTDYDYLEMKILLYLDKYGNVTDEDWTESEDFLNEYQIYLADPSNYTLNESAEGYNTYVKIYESITSTFGDYDLKENETAYLKFLIIYYLNNYGNVSANYTWNESDEFYNFHPKIAYLMESGMACGSASDIEDSFNESPYFYSNLNNFFNPMLNNSTNNSTSNETSNNATVLDAPDNNDSWWSNIVILVLVVILVALVII